MSGIDYNYSTNDYYVGGVEIRNSLNQHLTTNLATLHVPSQTGHSGKYLTTNGSTSSWQVLVIDIAQVNKAQLVSTVLSTDGANKAVYAIAFSTKITFMPSFSTRLVMNLSSPNLQSKPNGLLSR